MEYEEYLECAKKHIDSCEQILEGLKHNGAENKEAFLDVWYLSGYILEGFTVYSAYKLNDWNPPCGGKYNDKDIMGRYDKNFSRKTKLDYFEKRLVKGRSIFQELGIEIKYSVRGHGFQEIIKNILKKAPLDGLPVLGDGPVNEEVEKLIQAWKPEIRYWYQSNRNEEKNIKIPDLNQELLERLLNTCKEIYKQMANI